MNNYRVEFDMDGRYRVLNCSGKNVSDFLKEKYPEDYQDEVVFSGSLADCEAYIRLNDAGYM